MTLADEGYSGGTLDRPQFQRMMADAREKRFRAIVVYRLDRISRNIGDFAGLIQELNRLGIGFVSIREQFDTSSPMGRAMMYISSVFSQLERETIAERIRDNMHELSKTGRWLGGVTPTGYASESVSRVTAGGKVKRACRLRAVPEEIEVVKLIFHKFLETGSLTKTDTYLLNHGYRTKNGKQFSRFAIKGILRNPVYLTADEAAYEYFIKNKAALFSTKEDFDGVHGIMAYNRTLQIPGRATQVRPMEEWIVSVGGHEGTVDGETWVRAQNLLDRNSAKGYRRPRSGVALLSGILICGGCGDYMRPKLTERLNGRGERIYTYLCATKERSRGYACRMKNCGGNALDAGVMERISALEEDRAELVWRLEKSKGGLLEDGEDQELERLEREAAENDAEIGGLISALPKAADSPAEAYILRRLGELHERGERLKEALAERRRQAAVGALPAGELARLADVLSSFPGAVDSMTVEQKRAAVRALVRKIVWDGTDAHVVLYGSDNPFPERPLGEDSK